MSKSSVEIAAEITASALANHGTSGFELESYVEFYEKIFNKISKCKVKENELRKQSKNSD